MIGYRALFASILCFIAASNAVVVFAGPLNPPPGPVAPTQKPLAEIEPRTAVTAANTPGDALAVFRITQPGSYYLTGNLTGISGASGIVIHAEDVTLDLSGFTLTGVPGASHGIHVVAHGRNVRIRNGTVRDWPGDGVRAEEVQHSAFADLRAANNAGNGISVGRFCLVERCSAEGSLVGILTQECARIRDCSASGNATWAINAAERSTISGCTIEGGGGLRVSNGSAVERCTVAGTTTLGIFALSGCTIRDSTVRDCANTGIQTQGRATISGCTAENNAINGISAFSDVSSASASTVSNCTASGNAFNGIAISSSSVASNCSSEGNGGAGILAGSGSSVISCTVYDNGNSTTATTRDGINVASGSSVLDCSAYNNDVDGIAVGEGCTVSRCTATFNERDGIRAAANSAISGNTCRFNGRNVDGAGIHITGDDCRIEGNTLLDNTRGLDIDSAGNLVARNSASGNLANYDIIAGNKVGPIVNAPDSPVIFGTQGGAGVGSTDPWANFSY